jgi:chitodextrinase
MAKDTKRPTMPTGVQAVALDSTRVNVSWLASTDPVVPGRPTSGVKGYRVFRNGVLAVELPNPALIWCDTGRTPGESYDYSVAAVDNAGNQSYPSKHYSVTMPTTDTPVPDGPDTTAPTVPQNLSAVTQGEDQINLTWSASSDPLVAGQEQSGVVGYKVFRDGAQVATVALVPSYQDTGLVAETEYSYTVSAVDFAGNESAQSAAALATTTGAGLAPDTTAPTVPTNLQATAQSSSSINLTWGASTDPSVGGQQQSGLAGYQVRRDGLLVASPGLVTTYQDTGLAASTQYTYTVAARDAANNVSAQSASAQATTQAAAPSTAFKCVRQGATGSANGNDWTNAYVALPSALTRGTTYYVADGTYSGYTFDDAASGTQVITIKKATAADHGTETGWSAGYGDGQAVFGGCSFLTDYYVIDGQARDATWWLGSVSGYGIRFQGNGGKVLRLDNTSGSGGDNLTLRYCDLVGAGRDTGHGDDVVYSLANNHNVTFQYCALRDSDRTIFITAGGMTDWLVDHCYIARNCSTPAVHSEMISSWGSATGITFSHNIIEDIEGTAIWAFINDGNASNWKIYGNVIFHSASFNREGITGSIFCANDASNNNFLSNLKYFNNTHHNLKGLWSGVVIQGTTSNNEVRNNLWYSCCRTNSTASSAHSHNLYYNTVQDGDSTPTKVVLSAGESDIFVSASGKNFRLKVATAAGQSLASPYNVDLDGTTRGGDGTWDRGAYEFTG